MLSVRWLRGSFKWNNQVRLTEVLTMSRDQTDKKKPSIRAEHPSRGPAGATPTGDLQVSNGKNVYVAAL